MYGAHFGLARPPFRMTPDPELFFPGGNRGAVLEALRYAIVSGEGIVKVVGEVGSGKTMLCRMLEHELPEHCEIIYLANPSIASDQILHAIAFELGLALEADAPKLAVLHRLQDYLLEKHAAARRVVLFVEEAQGMPLETLEELRLLSNLETRRDKLLQIVLFGQPELDDKLRQHGIRQLLDRISYSFALPPFGAEQIRDYLNSRLRASGYRGDGLFTPGAIRAIGRRSNGLLRRINQLADKALLAAYADNAAQVTARHVRRAEQESPFAPRRGTGLALALLVLLALALASAGWFAWQAHAPKVTVAAPGDASSRVDRSPAVSTPSNDQFPIPSGIPETGTSGASDAIVRPHDLQPVPGPSLTLDRVRELAGLAATRAASQDAVTKVIDDNPVGGTE